jgi:hypothetical protein
MAKEFSSTAILYATIPLSTVSGQRCNFQQLSSYALQQQQQARLLLTDLHVYHAPATENKEGQSLLTLYVLNCYCSGRLPAVV